jgi:cytochrome d ubiquinol oxidase subunit II
MLTLENIAAGIILLGLIMYAIFGGADFGGGIWTAFASGPRAREQRESLFKAIGPVWETNHVWLIFVVVVLLTAFPAAFSAIFISLTVPLVVALVGINFRGAAFAFRHFGAETGRQVPIMAKTFEVSSILTPLALGAAVTATASGGVRIATGDTWSWLSYFTAVGGLIGLAICSYLAPIYMCVRTDGELREDFRMRGIIAALLLGIVTAVEIPVAMAEAPVFAVRLFSAGPAITAALAVLSGIVTLLMLWKRYFSAAQIMAATTVALILAGFAGAVFPDILIGELSISAAAAPRPTLVAFFNVLPFGIIILTPSLVFLYWTFRR